MTTNLAPIALFVYNRPKLAAQTLDCLMKNEEASRSVLHIFCDGPRPNASQEQKDRIRQVRKLVRQQNWCGEVHIEESEKNKGLANSIIQGVTMVVRKYGRAIILEDDLSVSPYFLRYMNEALDMYEKEEKVLAVHGYLYPVKLPEGMTDSTFFVRDPGSLGWGTWERAWALFEPDTEKLYGLLRRKRLQNDFNFWGGYPFMRMLRQQMRGQVDSWAIRWRASAYLHDKYTLHPAHSLVCHEGNVPEATHHYTEGKDYTYTDIYTHPIPLKKIPMVNNIEVERIFGKFLRKYSGMSLKSKILNRLRKMIDKNK